MFWLHNQSHGSNCHCTSSPVPANTWEIGKYYSPHVSNTQYCDFQASMECLWLQWMTDCGWYNSSGTAGTTFHIWLSCGCNFSYHGWVVQNIVSTILALIKLIGLNCGSYCQVTMWWTAGICRMLACILGDMTNLFLLKISFTARYNGLKWHIHPTLQKAGEHCMSSFYISDTEQEKPFTIRGWWQILIPCHHGYF
jgi:hypothetical protein